MVLRALFVSECRVVSGGSRVKFSASDPLFAEPEASPGFVMLGANYLNCMDSQKSISSNVLKNKS